MVARLDEYIPGWRPFIDKSNITLADANNCPLTQIGKKMFGLEDREGGEEFGHSVYVQMLNRFDGIDFAEEGIELFCDDNDLEAFLALI